MALNNYSDKFISLGNLNKYHDILKEELNGINGSITDIQGDITDIQGDITGINGSITDIQGDINDITKENGLIDSLSGRFDEYIEENNQKFSEVAGTISGIQGDIQDINGDIANKLSLKESNNSTLVTSARFMTDSEINSIFTALDAQ